MQKQSKETEPYPSKFNDVEVEKMEEVSRLLNESKLPVKSVLKRKVLEADKEDQVSDDQVRPSKRARTELLSPPESGKGMSILVDAVPVKLTGRKSRSKKKVAVAKQQWRKLANDVFNNTVGGLTLDQQTKKVSRSAGHYHDKSIGIKSAAHLHHIRKRYGSVRRKALKRAVHGTERYSDEEIPHSSDKLSSILIKARAIRDSVTPNKAKKGSPEPSKDPNLHSAESLSSEEQGILSDSKFRQTEIAAVLIDPLDEFATEAWKLANLLHEDFINHIDDVSPLGQFNHDDTVDEEFDAAPFTIVTESDGTASNEKVDWILREAGDCFVNDEDNIPMSESGEG